MGIFDRIKRIISSNINDDARSFSTILDESDEQLRRLIDELGKRQSSGTNDSARQQTPPSSRPSPQATIVYRAYTLLGIKPTASVQEIKSAYRTKMREVHPDRFASASAQAQEEAKRKAQELNMAYEILERVRGFR